MQQAQKHKAEGLVTGCADIISPLGFVCELKRKDHTKSTWQSGQQEWLKKAHDAGLFVCVGLGSEGGLSGWQDFIRTLEKQEDNNIHADGKIPHSGIDYRR